MQKLAGHVQRTAHWCTNISNVHGQVLNSVFTVSEGLGLEQLTKGIGKEVLKTSVINRYFQ